MFKPKPFISYKVFKRTNQYFIMCWCFICHMHLYRSIHPPPPPLHPSPWTLTKLIALTAAWTKTPRGWKTSDSLFWRVLLSLCCVTDCPVWSDNRFLTHKLQSSPFEDKSPFSKKDDQKSWPMGALLVFPFRGRHCKTIAVLIIILIGFILFSCGQQSEKIQILLVCRDLCVSD